MTRSPALSPPRLPACADGSHCAATQGGNTLKLKSASGKVVSSKRDELVALRDHFNIDVENPINVMTQDTSRQFLHQGNAKVRPLPRAPLSRRAPQTLRSPLTLLLPLPPG